MRVQISHWITHFHYVIKSPFSFYSTRFVKLVFLSNSMRHIALSEWPSFLRIVRWRFDLMWLRPRDPNGQSQKYLADTPSISSHHFSLTLQNSFWLNSSLSQNDISFGNLWKHFNLLIYVGCKNIVVLLSVYLENVYWFSFQTDYFYEYSLAAAINQ